MCIRDRLKPEYGWSSEIGMMKSIRLGKGNGFFDASLFLNEYKDMVEFSFNIFPEEPGGLEAVSYTHLRAHETVLDLVCRLLLEKKKTYTQHQKLWVNRQR